MAALDFVKGEQNSEELWEGQKLIITLSLIDGFEFKNEKDYKYFNDWCEVKINKDISKAKYESISEFIKKDLHFISFEVDCSEFEASKSYTCETIVTLNEDVVLERISGTKTETIRNTSQTLLFNFYIYPVPSNTRVFGEITSTIQNSPDKPFHIAIDRNTCSTSDLFLWGLIKHNSDNCSFEKFSNYIDSKGYYKNNYRKNGRIKNYDQILKLGDNFLFKKNLELPVDFETIINIIKNRKVKIADEKIFIESLKDNYPQIKKRRTIPYLAELNKDNPGILKNLPRRDFQTIEENEKIIEPMQVELIWSYWHEEAMLIQTMKAISLRFQNAFSPTSRNQLMNFTTDPLKPLSNIIWDFIKTEDNYLTVKRRAFEYDQQYGLKLYGKVVNGIKSVDSRSKFLEAFHSLLHICSNFFKEMDDRMKDPDAFPIRNALRELHLVLAEGGTNQYGDLPWTAKVEMFAIKYILSQPEMENFLRGRPMVIQKEKWMNTVDTMKKIQGWDHTSSTHYYELADKGEQILLSVRFGNWNDPEIGSSEAENWASFWRQDIQAYIHAYRTVTGVDLTKGVNTEMPGLLIMRKTRQAMARS